VRSLGGGGREWRTTHALGPLLGTDVKWSNRIRGLVVRPLLGMGGEHPHLLPRPWKSCPNTDWTLAREPEKSEGLEKTYPQRILPMQIKHPSNRFRRGWNGRGFSNLATKGGQGPMTLEKKTAGVVQYRLPRKSNSGRGGENVGIEHTRTAPGKPTSRSLLKRTLRE